MFDEASSVNRLYDDNINVLKPHGTETRIETVLSIWPSFLYSIYVYPLNMNRRKKGTNDRYYIKRA